MLGDGMKMAICAITLILLFLIWFVNGYMLRRRQKEFALQSIMGMEQRTIGRLFCGRLFSWEESLWPPEFFWEPSAPSLSLPCC